MQSTKNLENATLSNVKEKIVITEAGQQSSKARGEVAAQEQIRIFGQVFVTNEEPRAPRTRGEVAAQEQMRVVRQAMTYRPIQSREPKTRGEVAAQEQIKILSQVLKM
ncbi:MAG: hypothetical protein GEU26_14040 [Nitrososphaeraceae archaeon]|nr:hypothetical protein [Nitrososphaeraceae archaeon]